MPQIKEFLEMIMLATGTIALVFQLARVESKIFSEIDKTSDNLLAQITDLDIKLKIHLTECLMKEKHFNSCLYELKKRTDSLE